MLDLYALTLSLSFMPLMLLDLRAKLLGLLVAALVTVGSYRLGDFTGVPYAWGDLRDSGGAFPPVPPRRFSSGARAATPRHLLPTTCCAGWAHVAFHNP